MALQELLENLVEQIEEVVAKKVPIKEIATSAILKARGWLLFEHEPFLRPKLGGFGMVKTAERNNK